ncbi:MAG: TrkA family potassium uptake protein [Clostridia bacterium]|nr:TrkA family potassium uptake protein [Clostridia bacterium]
MKSVLVIGMGRYGRNVAQKMQELGNEVMIVDKHENIVEQLSADFTDAYIGDASNESVVKALGVKNFDLCFVATGENFQSSLMITMLLKRHGAKYVISKANQDIQAEILKEIGADEVVYPEKEIAHKIAIKHSLKNVFDFIPLSNDHSIYEIGVPDEWTGKTIGELRVRPKYNVNIVAVKSEDDSTPIPTAEYRFKPNDHIILIGKQSSVAKLK